MSANKAEIEITASTARLPAALRTAMKMMQGFVASTTGLLSKTSKKKDIDELGITKGAAIGGAAASLAVRGIDKLMDQASDVFKFNEALTRFGIATRTGGAQLANMGQSIREVSSQTGLGAIEILRGERALVDLGGSAYATTESMSLLARSAQASQTDVGDMATVMYALQHSLKVSPGELENTLGGLINLTKDGTVHFNQMAGELIGLAPVFSDFGITGREGAIQLASQLEVVRSGFGTAQEAATGLLRVYRSLPQHAKLFEKSGVKIFKPGSKQDLLTLDQILKNIHNSPLAKDRSGLIKAFGRGEAERSYRLLDKLIEEYERFERLGMRNGVVQEDSAAFAESPSGRIAIAFERMKNSIAEAFSPERIEKFVNALEGLVDKVGPLAEAFGKIGDVLGSLYGAGKSVRGFISSHGGSFGGPLAPTTKAQAELYSRENNVSVTTAYDRLQKVYDKARAMKMEIAQATKDDKTTPESNKIAARGLLTPATIAGEDQRSLAESYFREAGTSKEQIADLVKQALKDQVDSDIRSGNGRSVKPPEDFGVVMLKAFEAAAPAIGRSVASSMRSAPPPQVNLDGNRVSRGAGNATDKRRKP